MKAFIIMFNRVTMPKAMAEYLSDTCEVILVDNNSTYPHLLEWYNGCPYKIIWMKENRITWEDWLQKVLKTFHDRYFIITDHDLDLSQVPKDYQNVLMQGLERNEFATKAGLSLRIDDLPDNELTRKVIDHEKMFWEVEASEGFYKADISTTFALYDRERLKNGFLNAVRSKNYTARHLPWYSTEKDIDSEERYYQEHSIHQGWHV